MLKSSGIGYGNFQSNPNEEVEEVFAEDYDDLSHPTHLVAEVPQIVASVPTTTEAEEEDGEEEEVLACPNKWNPHHQCVDYCRQRWGVRTFQPDPNMLRRRDRMLRKYPLPDNWQEVADPETYVLLEAEEGGVVHFPYASLNIVGTLILKYLIAVTLFFR